MERTKKLLNNIGLKILAVAFSALLWLVAVNINDPVERKTFRDLKVELQNTGMLTQEGKTYQVLDETDTVTVTVRASRSVLEGISASDITATADFSELSFTNTVPIRLSVNKYIENQIQEISGSIDNMKLDVEDRIEKQFVIEIIQTGTPAEEYIVGKVTTTDGNAMKISGPESVISQVERAIVHADVNGLTDNINITEEIVLLNAEGEEIADSRITRSVTTANLSVTILRTRQIPVILSTVGEPDSDYRATGEIICAPNTVTIAGRSSAVMDVGEVVIPPEELDLTGATADVTKLIDIGSYLPESVSLTNLSEEFNGKVSVTVKVEPLVEVTEEIDKNRIQLLNVPEGYRASLDMTERVTVRLRGLQGNLDAMDRSELSGTVDLNGWAPGKEMAETLEERVRLEAALRIPEGVIQSTPVSVSVIIEKIVPDVEEE